MKCTWFPWTLLVSNLNLVQRRRAIGQFAFLSCRLPFWVKFLTSFNHLMAVANSSTNLALFSVIGTQFRATLLAILHIRKPPQRHPRCIRGHT